MGVEWQRWLRYAKAKIDLTVTEGEREMDRLEGEQAAAAEGKPWLSGTGDAPTFDEAKARIEDRARRAPSPPGGAAGTRAPDPTAPDGAPPAPGPSGDEAFDAEAHRRAAADRLAAIRDELGLGDEPGAGPDDPDEDPPRPPG